MQVGAMSKGCSPWASRVRGLMPGRIPPSMKVAKEHGPTVFLFVMVLIMVLVMTMVLCVVNGALAKGFWAVWPRQFLIAFPVALPVAAVARSVATKVVARLTA